jgi:hypothetical protein
MSKELTKSKNKKDILSKNFRNLEKEKLIPLNNLMIIKKISENL